MFSMLDLINSWLAYINVGTKLKSQIYTILGFFGWGYICYITYRFLVNGATNRGLLLLLVSVLMAYFLYLNIIYYFTKKSSKLDITPVINKVLHIKPAEETEGRKNPYREYNIPANGLYDKRKVIPASISSDNVEQKMINDLALRMIQNKLLREDYAGMSESQLKQLLAKDEDQIFAIGKGALIPYFSMKFKDGDYLVYAGINELEAQQVGKIKSVGLQKVKNIDPTEIKLYLAGAYLTGGKYCMKGRTGILYDVTNYHIELQVAYERR